MPKRLIKTQEKAAAIDGALYHGDTSRIVTDTRKIAFFAQFPSKIGKIRAAPPPWEKNPNFGTPSPFEILYQPQVSEGVKLLPWNRYFTNLNPRHINCKYNDLSNHQTITQF